MTTALDGLKAICPKELIVPVLMVLHQMKLIVIVGFPKAPYWGPCYSLLI